MDTSKETSKPKAGDKAGEEIVNPINDVPASKPIKIKDFYKQIGVTKVMELKYAGGYIDYSAYVSHYVHVLFNVKTEEKKQIVTNKVIEYAWKFKEGYIYEFGFDELGNMISVRNRNHYLCYFEKPNKIYFINIEKNTRKWANQPMNIKHPDTEEFKIKVKK